MLTVRGVYDGTQIRPLPSETLPQVGREVPVAIVFLEEPIEGASDRLRFMEAARRMLAARDAMEPMSETMRELIEEGRER